MAALQYVDVPGYAALLLRRTYTELSLADALMDRAHRWLGGTDARWNAQTHTWTFPSGATLTFGYLENERDKYRYSSAAYQYVGFDELTQFTESQYLYLFSRLRRLRGVSIPLRMRGASNPGGVGHDWVKERFVAAPPSPNRVFIPAKLEDNPHIDKASYMMSLSRLDPVTRAQMLNGDWNVLPSGTLLSRADLQFVDVVPDKAARVRFWDLAATEAGFKTHDPDYTAGVLMAYADGDFFVEDVVRVRRATHVDQLIRQVAEGDGRRVMIGVEREPGAAGKLFGDHLVAVLAGYTLRVVPVTGDKTTRALPWISQVHNRRFHIKRAAWTREYVEEICAFPQAGHDDQVDATSGAFALLSEQRYRWAKYGGE